MEFVAPEMSSPLTFHWYAGMVPPLTGEAVKVTCVPAETGLADAEIDTLTGTGVQATSPIWKSLKAESPVACELFEVSVPVVVVLQAEPSYLLMMNKEVLAPASISDVWKLKVAS